MECTKPRMIVYTTTHDLPMASEYLTHQFMMIMTSILVDATIISVRSVVLNIAAIGISETMHVDVQTIKLSFTNTIKIGNVSNCHVLTSYVLYL